MIITVTLNPAIDCTYNFEEFCTGRTNRPVFVREDAGGKGINVSKSLQQMGELSTATGFIAGVNGSKVQKRLEEKIIANNFVKLNEGETRINVKIVSESNGCQTEINNAGPGVSEEKLEEFLRKISELVRPGDIVVIGGSGYAGMTQREFAQIMETITLCGAQTIVDTSGPCLRAALGFDPLFIKPNLDEVRETFQCEAKNKEEILRIGRQIVDGFTEGDRRYRARTMIISLGKHGSYYFTKEHTYYGHPVKVQTDSCVGAGDAMVAAMAYSFNYKLPEQEAFRLAIAASLAVVTKAGTQIGTMEECKSFYEHIRIEHIE